MRVVLFGAGASFGSVAVYPRTPPLGSGLFEALSRLFPTWRSIPKNLSNLFDENFEVGMDEIIKKHGFSVAPLMQEMAIFFSIFHLPESHDNMYERFISSLNEPNIYLWSTLNYDCLFEIAGSRCGMQIDYFGNPEKSSDNILPVWKLHGSCNFKISGLDATRGVNYTGVVFGGGIEPIDPSRVRNYYSGNTSLYPAMALFAKGKHIAMSPAPIEKAQKNWAQIVKDADRVLVIGVNPNPDDNHIWDPLAKTGGTLAFVGSKQSFDAWVDKYRKEHSSIFLSGRWSDAESEVIDFITY